MTTVCSFSINWTSGTGNKLTDLPGESSILVGTLPAIKAGESVPGGFWGGPDRGPGSDSLESYLASLDYWDQDDYDDQYPWLGSAGSYVPSMDYRKGYGDYGKGEEYDDVSLKSYTEPDRSGNPSVEVEEALHEDPDSRSEESSADSENDEPLEPKAPLKARFSRACKPLSVTFKEALSSEDTPSPMAHSLRACVPTCISKDKSVALNRI
ncbi:hypothetical protein P4O66_000904 [Electrophorus voltai]|uniref:Uncharacterized protein n=1 Tax=Electrophorus voltai TaxID=2609070 RepID=A0AAD8ZBZ9_9TELE|nr:hypothetical protein P4O66_000904 [Electrophorus voltai]